MTRITSKCSFYPLFALVGIELNNYSIPSNQCVGEVIVVLTGVELPIGKIIKSYWNWKGFIYDF